MLTVLEIVTMVGAIIVPLMTPKKKYKELFVDTDTNQAHYAINPDGYLVKIEKNIYSPNN